MTTTAPHPSLGPAPDQRRQEIDLARSREWTWGSLLDRHAHEVPDAVALRYLDEQLTYRELRTRVDDIAAVLRAAGLGEGDRLAVVLLNRPEYLVACIAAGEVGAVVVPVNFRLSPTELAYLFSDCQPVVVLTEAVLRPLVDAAIAADTQADAGTQARVVLDVDADLTDLPRQHAELPYAVSDTAPAFIFYTSGTTGRPTGAVLSYRNLRAQAEQLTQAWQISSRGGDTVGVATPLFHIAGLAMSAGPLAIGATTAIQPLQNFDPVAVVESVEREHITALFLVPAQWQAMVAVPDVEHRMPGLRVAAWGAAPATPALLEAMGRALPRALVVAHFGQTEMSPNTCILFGEDALRKSGSVGRPVDSVQLRIVDDEGRDVPTGEVGEAVYRGAGLMLGYWENAEATAEAFEGGWFHSGDLVRADAEGFVYVVDRKKDMIITGGENVYCAEVEAAVAHHPAVLEVAVVGAPDERWGEVVVACLAAREGHRLPSVAELNDFLADRLASYKRPRLVHELPALPRNATGKVLKGDLRRGVHV